MKREGNAMRQWERRQRDWIRVQEDMAVKTGKVKASATLPGDADPDVGRAIIARLIFGGVDVPIVQYSTAYYVYELLPQYKSFLFCAIFSRGFLRVRNRVKVKHLSP